jgi:choline dehydrogenase-like flavoprotein
MTDARRVVVIGSGPSGAMAALTLVERGIPVTMLESGSTFPGGLVVRAFGRNLFRRWPRDLDKDTFVASGDPESVWHNVLVPGGLSNLWTGAVPRFAPEDFYEGERAHERYRWPVSYGDLAPYYTRVERMLRVVGERRSVPSMPAPEALVQASALPAAWQRLARHAESFGQGLVRVPLADGPAWLVRRTGAAFNSFDSIVRSLQARSGLELRLGAHAAQLTWDGTRARVSGVEYIDRASKMSDWIDAIAVVVAGGSLATPKLLLQSVSNDFPHGLGNSSGVLGRYLHDHPHDWCELELDRPLPRLATPVFVTRAPYASATPLSGALIELTPLSKWDRLLSLSGATSTRFGVVTFGSMLPEERNQVRLDPGKHDTFGLPLLDIRIEYGPDAQRNVQNSHRQLQAILRSAGIGSSLSCPVERLTPGGSVHYGGGVRMHDSPQHGVLTRWNRLHDVPNVAVVDASSFTTGVEKNPTLTAMALSARAADRLADDLLDGTLDERKQLPHAVPTLR